MHEACASERPQVVDRQETGSEGGKEGGSSVASAPLTRSRALRLAEKRDNVGEMLDMSFICFRSVYRNRLLPMRYQVHMTPKAI